MHNLQPHLGEAHRSACCILFCQLTAHSCASVTLLVMFHGCKLSATLLLLLDEVKCQTRWLGMSDYEQDTPCFCCESSIHVSNLM